MKKDSIELPEIENGKYLHTKSEHYYEVLGVALQTETGEALVVYKPLYESKHELFVRPYSMFIEVVEIEGRYQPRFQKVKD